MSPADRCVVWLAGALADPADASVHWSDHGLTVGDGVFETIELRRGAPFALRRHLERLDRSAQGLGLEPPDPAELSRAVAEVAAAWGEEPGRLRITYTAGPGPMGSNRGTAAPTLLLAATDASLTEPTDVLVGPSPATAGPWQGSRRRPTAGASWRWRSNEAGCSGPVREPATLCEGTGSGVVVGLDGTLVTRRSPRAASPASPVRSCSKRSRPQERRRPRRPCPCRVSTR
jgi:branched-chain amino acid aminotransferase